MLDLAINIGRAIMVPITIPTSPTQGQQLALPLNGTIQNPNTEVVAVEAVANSVMAVGPNGTTGYGSGAGASVNMTLNLFSGSMQITQDMPLGLLDPSKNGGYLRTFQAFEVALQQSYITLTGPGAGYTAGNVIYLIFYVRDKTTGR